MESKLIYPFDLDFFFLQHCVCEIYPCYGCSNSLIFIVACYSMVGIYHNLFFHSIYGHLCCFWFGAIINNVASNIFECLLVNISVGYTYLELNCWVII